ncbi:hypothetical protein ANOM_006523 [Aspergillus nomiae NRRL 13137]|uniref:NF-X1-type domain-containing protein n=1 Tax=Aspergillus nomiae NRRL (strain ATCC 15546 / NRRL 13137 / CBS 260.88 / M93) TaxID=1509407 RepID=A0A0L1J0B8_ASPN3|nr:uncharacterized protein ANOM_006523 [Aspergillus nomiae NRRL 13137]KNG85251.1 hypothetical protein ANOM_006523 [Aspergillus nomiae NRRL 13137]
MSDAPAPVAEGSASRPRPSRRGGRGRGNRSHRRPQTQTTERSHDAQPPTQPPSQIQSTQNPPSDPSADAPRSRRGPRRGRGGGRGGGAPSEGSSRRQRQRGGDRGTTSTGRRFEGRLTKAEQAPEDEQIDATVDTNDLGLRADAPAFVPGTQPEHVANKATPSTTAPAKKKPKAKNAPPPPPKVTTKSVAPDIATRIHEDIAHNLYEFVSRNGRRTKVLLRRTLLVAREKETPLPPEPGAVLAVTFPKKYFHQTTLAGVRKKLTRGRFPAFHLIHADRPVHGSGKAVRTRAIRPVMLDPARHVQLWALLKIAFAAGIRPPSVVRIPIMKMDGAAGKSVGIFCRAASILALDPATRVSVTEMLCSSKDEEMDSQMLRDEDGEESHVEEWTECPCRAVADATLLCPFATKVLLSTLSVSASARLACIVVAMLVLSGVVPANRRRLNVRLCGGSSSLIFAQVMKMWRPNISALECVAMLKNVPCWLADARCGRICGETLKCGSHTCKKNCHRPGDCEDTLKPCQQPCGKTKTMCGHPCTEPCHAPYPCPEKTPCSSKITVTCGCGRLRQERRCNAAKAVASKGQVQQPQRLPAVTPLTCDDECARLERNRSLASALGVDINPSTTVAQNLTATNLPYSSETLDIGQSNTTFCTLSAGKVIPAGVVHSLATDWGFASESFDPEPHRHVFVLKPTVWNPPLLGMGNGTAIGIGGMSVSECVKLRERQRQKEREAQRLAAAESKAQREAVKAQANAANEGGWAQVAASRRSNASTRSTTPNPGTASRSGSMFAALAGDDGSTWGAPKKEKLVLRSGVGAGKQMRTRQPAAEVVDSWEEEEEKQELEERAQEREQEQEQEQDDGQGDIQKETTEIETTGTGEAIATSSAV